jgi:hypothetical protein
LITTTEPVTTTSTASRAGEERRDPSPIEERRNESRYGLVTEQTGWLEKPLWGLIPAHG